MVFPDSSIPVDHHIKMTNSTDPCSKVSKSNQINQSRKMKRTRSHLNLPICDESRYAVIDFILLIAVLGACGFLFYPYAAVLAHKTVEIGEEVIDVVSEEIVRAPMAFACLGVSFFLAAAALVAIAVCTDGRCGRPNCRGLRDAAEFDIQLETEEAVRKSNGGAVKKGLFELHREHHRELEAELKKVAPTNGRAVLIYRSRCGCSIGRMEVMGPRKSGKVRK